MSSKRRVVNLVSLLFLLSSISKSLLIKILKLFMPVQKYFSSTKIFIPVQKYFSSTKMFIPVLKHVSCTNGDWDLVSQGTLRASLDHMYYGNCFRGFVCHCFKIMDPSYKYCRMVAQRFSVLWEAISGKSGMGSRLVFEKSIAIWLSLSIGDRKCRSLWLRLSIAN